MAEPMPDPQSLPEGGTSETRLRERPPEEQFVEPVLNSPLSWGYNAPEARWLQWLVADLRMGSQ